MSWFWELANDRTRALACFFILGILASLPAPSENFDVSTNLILGSLWVFHIALLYALFKNLTDWGIWYFLSFLISLVTLLQLGLGLPIFLNLIWFLWFYIKRRNRAQNFSRLQSFVIALCFFSNASQSQSRLTASQEDAENNRSVLARKLRIGLRLKEVSSCGALDRMPWKVAGKNRQYRSLVRDNLRINSELKFSSWELTQILEPAGATTFVFRRQVEPGLIEAHVLREKTIYVVHVGSNKRMRIVQERDVRAFINKPVYIFESQDGSTLTYLPGAATNGSLIFQLKAEDGSAFDPLVIKGNSCTRPDLPPTFGDPESRILKSIGAQQPTSGNFGSGNLAPGNNPSTNFQMPSMPPVSAPPIPPTSGSGGGSQ